MSDLGLVDSGHTASSFRLALHGNQLAPGLCALLQPWWCSLWP